MRSTADRSRLVHLILVGLLVVCIGQVVWWILDEVHYSRLVREWLAAVHPESALHERLQDAGRGRLNRYLWEGAFFLAVLVAGIIALLRALRGEAELRRRQENFVAAVSHEFKTPMASMRLSAETLALRESSPERRRQLVQRILDDLGRLETMVFNLLDTARLEEAKFHYRPERVRLLPAAEATLERFRRRAEEGDVRMELEVPPDLEVTADPSAVRTVMENLMDNALKATAGRAGGSVSVRARRDEGYARLEVADNGIGFPPGRGPDLFEKFFRLGHEMRRSSPGSGLGLYLVRRLVELGGGRVSAHSEGEGRGAVFATWWPLAREGSA